MYSCMYLHVSTCAGVHIPVMESQGQAMPKVGVSQAAGTVTERTVVWAKKRKGDQLRAEGRSLSGWSVLKPKTQATKGSVLP